MRIKRGRKWQPSRLKWITHTYRVTVHFRSEKRCGNVAPPLDSLKVGNCETIGVVVVGGVWRLSQRGDARTADEHCGDRGKSHFSHGVVAQWTERAPSKRQIARFDSRQPRHEMRVVRL